MSASRPPSQVSSAGGCPLASVPQAMTIYYRLHRHREEGLAQLQKEKKISPPLIPGAHRLGLFRHQHFHKHAICYYSAGYFAQQPVVTDLWWRGGWRGVKQQGRFTDSSANLPSLSPSPPCTQASGHVGDTRARAVDVRTHQHVLRDDHTHTCLCSITVAVVVPKHTEVFLVTSHDLEKIFQQLLEE